MLIKELRPSDWWQLDPYATHVKVASTGLRGNDLKTMIIKVGQENIDFVKKAIERRQPGEVLLYLVGLGCTEKTGSNRNGDGFKLATLLKHHTSFRTLPLTREGAYYYRDHDNKDTHKSYGIVKDSMVDPVSGRVLLVAALNGNKEAASRNQALIADKELDCIERGEDIPQSMSCIIDPTTPTLTLRGYVPISEVVVGDMVYTHQGRWRRVTHINRRTYTGDVVRLNFRGLPWDVELTADHPLYARVLDKYPDSSAGRRPMSQWLDEVEEGETPFDWTHAGCFEKDLRVAVRPVTSVPGLASIDDASLAQLLGIYTAEGSVGFSGGNPNTVVLSIGKDDWAVTGVPALIQKTWPNVSVGIRTASASQKAMNMAIYSADLARWMLYFVGQGSRNKKIPGEIFNSGLDIKLAFVGRWLDGDGFCDKKGAHWSTVNAGLALQLRDLLLSCGLAASIYRIQHPERSINGGKSMPPYEEFTINLSNFDLDLLAPWSEKASRSIFRREDDRRGSPSLVKVDNEFYSYRAGEPTRYHAENIYTYNIEVEEDESYSLLGFVSHNCRVSFDKCASCGNEAKTRKQYCTAKTCKHGGCAENLGRVYEDGFVQHVDNPDPDFFDMSHITMSKQADRVAFAIGPIGDALNKRASTYRCEEEMWVEALARLEQTADAQRLGWLAPMVKQASTADVNAAPDISYLTALSAIPAVLPYRTWCKLAGKHADGSSVGLYSRMLRQEKFPKFGMWTLTASPQAVQWARKCEAAIALTGRGIFKAAAVGLGIDNRLEIKADSQNPVTESEIAYAGYQLQLSRVISDPAACRLMVTTNFLS